MSFVIVSFYTSSWLFSFVFGCVLYTFIKYFVSELVGREGLERPQHLWSQRRSGWYWVYGTFLFYFCIRLPRNLFTQHFYKSTSYGFMAKLVLLLLWNEFPPTKNSLTSLETKRGGGGSGTENGWRSRRNTCKCSRIGTWRMWGSPLKRVTGRSFGNFGPDLSYGRVVGFKWRVTV